MYRFIYLLILLLTALTSFEDFILKFLPVPDKIYFYSRFISELLIYLSFFCVITSKLVKRIPLARTPLDLPIFLFLASAALSIIVNRSPIFGSLVNLRPLIRFFILFYLTVNLPISCDRASKITPTIIIAGAAQAVIGILQSLSRGALDSILLPRATDTDIGGVSKDFILVKSGREIGSIYAATGDTVIYAVFLILIFTVIISKLHTDNFKSFQSLRIAIINRRLVKLRISSKFLLNILILGLVIAITLTYVRIGLFSVIIIGILHSFRVLGRAKTLVGLSTAALLFILYLTAIPRQFVPGDRTQQRSIVTDITGVFTEDYLEVAKQQRLGALIGIAPTVIFNKPILGYGGDRNSVIDDLNASKISFLTKVWTVQGFKDVYWVAILTFYGLAGLISMVWMFWRLYYCAVTIHKVARERITQEISLAVTYIVTISAFLLFFNQTIEFRTYGFYFWFLSGLMFNLYGQEKNQSALRGD